MMHYLVRIFTASSFKLWLWLCLLVAAVFSEIDLFRYWIVDVPSAVNVIGLISLAVLKATVLTLLSSVTSHIKWLNWIVNVFIGGFFLLSALNGFCWIFYGFGISRKLFTIAVETNGNELSEFLPELIDKFKVMIFSLWFVGSLILFIILWKLLPMISKKWFGIITSALSVVGVLYLGYIFGTAEWGKSNNLIYARTYQSVRGVLRNMKMLRQLQAVPRIIPDAESAVSSKLAKKIIVVIGESASRDHLSAYGYPLPTSPSIDTISEGVYLFKGAVASSTSTAENLPRLLSFMTDEPGEKEWYEYPTLLQLFHKLGYRTYWLSNQERTGEWSNLSGILSGDADVVKYLGREDSEDHLYNQYDEVVLSPFKESINSCDTLQLTFLHLMGSHFQYDNRFPDSRRRIKAEDVVREIPRKWHDKNKSKIIANYDNSILYTDSILNEVITQVRKQEMPAIVIYVADHGENVYDDRDYRGRDAKYVRVPFIVYANEAYRIENPDIIEEMNNSLHREFSTSELPQIIMHLSGSRYQLYDPVRDPLSPLFHTRRRYVDGAVAVFDTDNLTEGSK